MVKRYILYGILTLIGIAFITGVIHYAVPTHTPPPSAQGTHAETLTPTETAGKKKCGCCADRIARVKEQIRKVRQRRQALENAKASDSK
ncbi:hypothetical protein C6503_17315 [Candidatus Poribacteria bacterium]|nr:MAG: hypothetical protein C6503_17315 [Candidatus Poribacteria bacterium]